MKKQVPFKLGWLEKDKEDPLRPKNQVNKVDYFHLRTGKTVKTIRIFFFCFLVLLFLPRAPLMMAEPPSLTRVGITSAAEQEFSMFLSTQVFKRILEYRKSTKNPENNRPLRPEELWVKREQRSLLEARLFPVFSPRGGAVGLEGGVSWLLGGSGSLKMWREAWKLSLKDVMALTNQEAELQWREELFYLAERRRVRDALCNGTNVCLLPCFRAAVLGGRHRALLETLDNSELQFLSRKNTYITALLAESLLALHPNRCCMCFVLRSLLHLVAAGHREQEVESVEELGLAARCLICIADVLVDMAGGKGGLRSGPAANKAWSSAYLLLEKDLSGGIQALAAQREKWLCR